MRVLKILMMGLAVAMVVALMPPAAHAQVSFGINIGAAPVCPYGYYSFPPYDCAPYGYYGPEWFNGGVFLGAGPWFHGPAGFHGYVNHRYDPHYGYHGPYPAHNEHFDAHRNFHDFHGNAMHDGHGNEYHGRGNSRGHH